MNPLSAPFPAPAPLGSTTPELPSPAPPVAPLPQGTWPGDLQATSRDANSWLWHGILRSGAITLLTSQWKSGKTTMVAVLLARLRTGGELAGLAVGTGKAVVVSEEAPALWSFRHKKLDFGDNVCLFCRPFSRKPRPDEWQALLDHIAELHARHHFRLLVIDTLATFLPGRNENLATLMLENLLPLQRLAQLGLSIWLQHHPGKGEPRAGQAARGSGALMGYVDILMEMQFYRHAADEDRRRRLQSWSRFDETPRQLVIELNAEGTDYRACIAAAPEEFLQCWEVLQTVLAGTAGPMTLREVLQRWPSGCHAPGEVTLWRWLKRACAMGLLFQQGTGRRTDPFRYGRVE